jgi:hypothetical protein
MVHTSAPWERRRPTCSGSGQDGRAPRRLQALVQDLGYGNTEQFWEALHGLATPLAAYIRQLREM